MYCDIYVDRLKEGFAAACKERDELKKQVAILSAALDRTVTERDALLSAVRGRCSFCKHGGGDDYEQVCFQCIRTAAKELAVADYWELADLGKKEDL